MKQEVKPNKPKGEGEKKSILKAKPKNKQQQQKTELLIKKRQEKSGKRGNKQVG